MNKKTITIIVVLVVLAVLSISGIIFGIHYINNKPFRLEEKYYDNMSIIDIDHKRYEELVDKKENFVLYLTLEGCTTCAHFRPIAVDFITTNKEYLLLETNKIKLLFIVLNIKNLLKQI